MDKKLIIVSSHPIQYYAPMFRCWAQHISLHVLYCHQPTDSQIGNQGFGKSFQWDVDLLSGYSYTFLENKAKNPSLDSFWGCHTPQIGQEIRKLHGTHILILGWYLRSFWQAYFFAKRAKIPVAVRGDSQLNPTETSWKVALKKKLYPLFLRRYDRIFYVGKRNKEYVTFFGARPNQLLFSPHAVDQDFWKRKSSARVDKQKTTFVWVGKFIDKKRPMEMVQAFMGLPLHDMELYMVGDGPLRESCQVVAKKDQRIHFLGFKNQKELVDLFETMDALVLNSDHGETWGLVVNEAMAMGLPCIVSEACGCQPDMVLSGVTGFSFPLGNALLLQSQLLLFHEDKLKWNKKLASAIEETNKIYSYENSLPALREFLKLAHD